MKKLNVETLVPSNYKYVARDMDGKGFAFENKPDIATDIAKNAVDMSKHAGRKTVKAEDVKLASKTSGKI